MTTYDKRERDAEWWKNHVLHGLSDLTSDPELSGLAGALLSVLTLGEDDDLREPLERLRREAESAVAQMEPLHLRSVVPSEYHPEP